MMKPGKELAGLCRDILISWRIWWKTRTQRIGKLAFLCRFARVNVIHPLEYGLFWENELLNQAMKVVDWREIVRQYVLTQDCLVI